MKWTKYLQVTTHFLFFVTLILVLSAGYYVEFVQKNTPCTLCYLQRLGMALAAVCLFMNLRDKPSTQNLGVCLLAALFGSLVSLRHNALKFCCESASHPTVLGKTLPIWAFWVFGFSMIAIAVLLLFKESGAQSHPFLFKIAFVLLSIVLILGAISSFFTRGFGF